MKIKTNNVPRDLYWRSDVPDQVLADQFDWLSRENEHGFFKYRGNWYHLSQFMRFGYPEYGITEHGYHAYLSESSSTGVMIEIVDDERIVAASYTNN